MSQWGTAEPRGAMHSCPRLAWEGSWLALGSCPLPPKGSRHPFYHPPSPCSLPRKLLTGSWLGRARLLRAVSPCPPEASLTEGAQLAPSPLPLFISSVQVDTSLSAFLAACSPWG